MKSVLVAGAAGVVGDSVVRALLADDETRVFATSRKAERLDVLRSCLPHPAQSRFTAVAGDAGDFAGATRIARDVEERGGIDAAVAILGRGTWTSGPTLELAPHEWNAVLAEMLTAHFAFARAVVPLLAAREGALYLSIGGGAAFAPVRDAGLMSVAAAGQAMLTRVLAGETTRDRPRIVELVIDGPVSSNVPADAGSIPASDVGRVVSEIVLTGETTWPATQTSGPLIVMGRAESGGSG